MNGVIARITLGGLLGRRRFLLLLPLPLILIAAALIGRASGADPADWSDPVLSGIGFGVVLPLIAVIVGTGVLGTEIDDGSIVNLITTPVPRRTIVLTKLAVATGVTVAATALPLFVAGVIVASARLGFGLAIGAVAGAAAYTALFLALSLVSRRPVLIGLAYLVVWESTLANLLSGVRLLSVQQYALAIADAVASTPLVTGKVSAIYAVIASLVVLVGGAAFAVDRLRSFSVRGETG